MAHIVDNPLNDKLRKELQKDVERKKHTNSRKVKKF